MHNFKNLNALLGLILLATVSLTFTSCGDDDDTVDLENRMVIDGTSYDLEAGFFTDFGDNGNGSFDFDLWVSDDAISVQNGTLTGTGNGLYLDLNSGVETGLESGTYTFAVNRAPFTIVAGSAAFTNFNFNTASGTQIAVTSGTAVLNITGNTYDIDFDLMGLNGINQVEITGNYSGVVQEF